MLKTHKFAALAILTALAITPAFAEDKSVAVVNGVAIPQARVETSVKAAQSQGRADSPELRQAIRDDLINREVIVQAAVKEGLDKTPDVIDQINMAKQSVLVNAFVQDSIKKTPITDAQLQQEYDNLKAKLGDKEYSVSHILVKTEAEAKKIIAELGKKVKFDKLAKESIDTGSAEHGGSLGWTVPKNLVEPFANALLNLKKGEYTKEPVKTQFGWHVIRLDDIRALKVPAFNELKPQLQQRLQQQAIQKTVADLRSAAKID
jgi:peptidyl-prolyl cis-trans isomerase C